MLRRHYPSGSSVSVYESAGTILNPFQVLHIEHETKQDDVASKERVHLMAGIKHPKLFVYRRTFKTGECNSIVRRRRQIRRGSE
jgi:hypothetical protein